MPTSRIADQHASEFNQNNEKAVVIAASKLGIRKG
jgi:hypothetical protein